MTGRSRFRWFVAFFATVALLLCGAFGATGCGDDKGSPPAEDGPDAHTWEGKPDASKADSGTLTAEPDAATTPFNVTGAKSKGNEAMTVTFDAPPNEAQATALGSYEVPGLTLSGKPTLAGNVVTIATSPQEAKSYTVTVSGVTRASDGATLTTVKATFGGRGTFNVASATAVNTKKIKVSFDAPPAAAEATNLAHYDIPGLTLSDPQLAGTDVTFTTTQQSDTAYTLTVTGVTRASDAQPLSTNTALFTGHTPFAVAAASSTNAITMTVTFDAPPDAAAATTLANYAVTPALALSGTPALNGNTVTITTAAQADTKYTVTVSNVTRAGDAEPLGANTADFDGTPVLAPTITNVVVTKTVPDNGTTPYNTGTVKVTITGTDFLTVDCAGALKGVKLDDLNGIDVAVGTRPIACTVVSDTEISATFPAGIRTNGTTGWNVIVTNATGSNATSAVKLVPKAGLLISEVYTGKSGGGLTQHEFIEIYNPTGTSLDTTAGGIGLKLHVRNGSGTDDTSKTLTLVTTGIIPSHGFLLVASNASDSNDAWYATRDYTFSAALVPNGGAYLSLSDTDDVSVIDKVGWGSQPAGGYEGTALADLPNDVSAERKPAGGAGHATDTDSNVDDFNAASTTITPRGIADGAQP